MSEEEFDKLLNKLSKGNHGTNGSYNVLGSDGYMYQQIYMGCIFDPKTNRYYDHKFSYPTDNEGMLDFHNRKTIEEEA